jgi:hypothetical protein
VVYDIFLSNTSPNFFKTPSTRVLFPTPEGPTIMRGLNLRGVGLNGWKYSFEKTKTSSYVMGMNCFRKGLLACEEELKIRNHSKLL